MALSDIQTLPRLQADPLPSSRSSMYETSKYGVHGNAALVPYAYEPALDDFGDDDDEDGLKALQVGETDSFPWRGLANVSFLVVIILALLLLFAFYPALSYYRMAGRMEAVAGNVQVNNTGQTPVLIGASSSFWYCLCICLLVYRDALHGG